MQTMKKVRLRWSFSEKSLSTKNHSAITTQRPRWLSRTEHGAVTIADGVPVRQIRLSKRMSEIDLCSRREADRLIRERRVFVDGKVVEIGGKVPADLLPERINIGPGTFEGGEDIDEKTDAILFTPAVVLNKPVGYVSGQADHGNSPAIRLLTPKNLWKRDETATIPSSSWDGFAPAGRLDLDSTGLLVFSRLGVVTKKLIAPNSTVEKEYFVRVSPAVQATRYELRLDPNFQTPKATLDLTPLLEGGRLLLGDEKKEQLKPCVDAQWIRPGEFLRIVLAEGRKRQIRRACRELLGWHVTGLQRVRIGPIRLEDMPEGRWRPLRPSEVDELLSS
jgi:23S rRNA pseudouridine2604 synthase